jgi:Protein of unknown function (DUF2934)
MSKKSTAPKTTTTTKSTASKTSRKASATRTKLPAASPEVIEAMAPPAAIVEVAIAQPEAQPEVSEIIEAMAPPARTVTRDELTALVRREAYLRAQRRGFRNGNPFEDWVLAEADVRAQLATEGVSLPVA